MQKMTILILSIAIISMTACNKKSISKSKVPDKVMVSFKEKFPDIKNEKWEMIDSNIYEASFKLNDKEMYVDYRESGEWLETEYKIEKSELPQSVSLVVENEFVTYTAEEYRKVDSEQHGECYHVKLKKDSETMWILLSENGVVLNKRMID